MRPLSFTITPEVEKIGVKVVTAHIWDVDNTVDPAKIDGVIDAEIEKLKSTLTGSLKEDSILQGFRELHSKIGRSNREYIASPEKLLSLLIERNIFPRINPIVDLYNLISVKTRLALGAHDVRNINGTISLRMTSGNELFIPLGTEQPQPIFPNEYGYCDEEQKVLCRMEVLQCEQTKTVRDTTELFLIIQGNRYTEIAYVTDAAKEVCELITSICGGNSRFLNIL